MKTSKKRPAAGAVKPTRSAIDEPGVRQCPLRLPAPLIKALDQQAAANLRSRNAEAVSILSHALVAQN